VEEERVQIINKEYMTQQAVEVEGTAALGPLVATKAFMEAQIPAQGQVETYMVAPISPRLSWVLEEEAAEDEAGKVAQEALEGRAVASLLSMLENSVSKVP